MKMLLKKPVHASTLLRACSRFSEWTKGYPKSVFWTVVFCALLWMNPRASAQEPRAIYYGTSASPAQLPTWVAKDAGLFARHGLNVEPVQIRGGSLITLAIMTGDLQFSGVGAESIVAARIAGGDVVLLACPIDVEPVYLITRPEIKSAAGLRGQASAVTRYGSTTHFYLRAALRHVGLDPERDLTILQLGSGPEMVAAMDAGRIAAAAFTMRYAIPFLQRGWPVLADLSKTDLVYPSSCVATSRTRMKAEPKLLVDFLKAYVAGIHLIKKDHKFAEKSFSKWLREKDPTVVKASVTNYARLFKPAPFVPDKGLDNVVIDMLGKRPELKEFVGLPEAFRENGPLQKALGHR